MKLTLLFWLLLSFKILPAQEVPLEKQQQLEMLVDAGLEPDEIDFDEFQKKRLSLNRANTLELEQLGILNAMQIKSLLEYRRLLGPFISVYELQAVPGWNIDMIKRLLPIISLDEENSILNNLRQQLKNGQHQFLVRVSQVLQDEDAGKYMGSEQHVFFRYKYAYQNHLQFGITGDKDAGEQLFRGVQKTGFDFYSFHAFIRRNGFIRAIALGDFTINMGQGLVQWQSLAFKKNGDPMMIKRTSQVLRPYNAAGEFNFYRGAGISLQKKRLAATLFLSRRKLSATIARDSGNAPASFSAFRPSGYYRNETEIAYRNNLQQITAGIGVGYQANNGHIGFNGVYHHFSLPLQKDDQPYLLYAMKGRSWINASADYSYTFRNIHLFGEVCIDKYCHLAVLQGCMMAIDRKVDIAMVYRSLARGYQALNANAFTENTTPSNESGFYAGMRFRISDVCRLDAYADVYRFPWLKFRVDAPSDGRDYLIQLTYSPHKQAEIVTRYRNSVKGGNASSQNGLMYIRRQDWRIHMNIIYTKNLSMRTRFDWSWYGKAATAQHGFLAYTEGIYEWRDKHVTINLRMQAYEIEDYNSRIYIYEADVSSSFSLPVYTGKGISYYWLLQYKMKQGSRFSLRWMQRISANEITSSTLSNGAGKAEIKFQYQQIF